MEGVQLLKGPLAPSKAAGRVGLHCCLYTSKGEQIGAELRTGGAVKEGIVPCRSQIRYASPYLP